MANRQIYQLTANTNPSTTHYFVLQDNAGAQEAVKSTVAEVKAAMSLDNVDNTSDASKPISTAAQAALNNKADLVGGKVPASQLPAYVDEVQEYANLAAFPATGTAGILFLALDTNWVYRWSGSVYVKVADAAVSSVNAKTGDVVLTKTDLGLSNVDNTSDLNKPVSTATQTALSAKEAIANKDTDGTLAANSDVKYPSQKAVKTYVDTQVSSIAANSGNITGVKSAHGFAVGYAVYKDASGVWQRSTSVNNTITSSSDGIITSVVDANTFIVGRPGTKFSTVGLGLTAGTKYYLAPTSNGVNYTSTEPTTVGQVLRELFQTNIANEATIINGPALEITTNTGGSGSGSGEQLITGTKNAHGFAVGWAVFKDASGIWQRSSSANATITSSSDGVIVSVTDANNFVVGRPGTKFSTSGLGLTAGTKYYLAPSSSGLNYTATSPTTVGQVIRELFQTNTANEATVINGQGFEITPASSGGSGDVVLLASGSVVAGSTEANISFAAYIAQYKVIKIKMFNVAVSADGLAFKLRTSSNNTTYDSGPADYSYRRDFVMGVDSANTDAVKIGDFQKSGNGSQGFITYEFINPNSSSFKPLMRWVYECYGQDGSVVVNKGVGFRETITSVQAAKIFVSTGTYSADYQVWGEK